MRGIGLFVIGCLLFGCDKTDAKSKGTESTEKTSQDEESPKKKKKPAKTADDEPEEPKSEKKAEPVKTLDQATVKKTLNAYYAKYVDGSDFTFFKDYYPPTVDKFITLENASVDAMIKDSRAFYKSKTNLKYAMKQSTLVVAPEDAGTSADFVLSMAWDYPAPAAWQADGGNKTVSRAVDVKVHVVFGGDGKIHRYEEKGLELGKLRVTKSADLSGPLGGYATPIDAYDDDAGKKPLVKIAKGTVVQDAGESYVVATNAKGEVVAHKIHGGGKDYWAMERSAMAVENPNGGTSAGEAVFLEKVP